METLRRGWRMYVKHYVVCQALWPLKERMLQIQYVTHIVPCRRVVGWKAKLRSAEVSTILNPHLHPGRSA